MSPVRAPETSIIGISSSHETEAENTKKKINFLWLGHRSVIQSD